MKLKFCSWKALMFICCLLSLEFSRTWATPYERDALLDERILANEWRGWFPVMDRYLLIRKNRSMGFNPVKGFTWELRLCQQDQTSCEHLGQIDHNPEAKDDFSLFLQERIEALEHFHDESSMWDWNSSRYFKRNRETLSHLWMELSQINSLDNWFGRSELDCDLYGKEEFDRFVDGIKKNLIGRPSESPGKPDHPSTQPLTPTSPLEEEMAAI